MCGRFVLMTPGRSLAESFKLEEVPDPEPRYNIAPAQIGRRRNEKNNCRLGSGRWSHRLFEFVPSRQRRCR